MTSTALLCTSRSLVKVQSSAGIATAFVVTTPVLLFFSTQVENHAHHYLWIVVFLLALDRGLPCSGPDSEKQALWSMLLCGLLWLPVYFSHSTSVLLVPALLLFLHMRGGGKLLRLPERRELLRYTALLLPLVLAKVLIDPMLKAWLFENRDVGKGNQELRFALSLMELRSPSEWLDYLYEEVFLALPGLWLGTVLLFALAVHAGKSGAIVLAVVVLPYILVFGHWPVREHGAYYIATLPVAAICLAGMEFKKPSLRIILSLLIIGQSAVAIEGSRRWLQAKDGIWIQARSIADFVGQDRVGKDTVVICYAGSMHYYLERKHGIQNQSIEIWNVIWQQTATEDPKAFAALEQKLVPQIIRPILEKHRIFMTEAAVQFMKQGKDLAGLLLAMQRQLIFVPAGEGYNKGYWLRKRKD